MYGSAREIIVDSRNHLSAREIFLTKMVAVTHSLRCERCIIKSSELYNEHKNSYMNILKLCERIQINSQHMKFLRKELYLSTCNFPFSAHTFFSCFLKKNQYKKWSEYCMMCTSFALMFSFRKKNLMPEVV
jgi:hypothetical protein